MSLIYLQLGSNQGERLHNIRVASEMINVNVGKIITSSGIYETEAWGYKQQPPFLNSVIVIHSNLNPFELLNSIKKIEKALKRSTTFKWGPRTIDIDILFFEDEILNSPDLIIPHPFIQDRKFVLFPLNEIAPDLIHPVLHKKISDLLIECKDKGKIRKYKMKNNG